MSEKLLTEMSYDEFGSVIDSFIERSSKQSGEMPAASFFDLLFIHAAQRVQKKPLKLKGELLMGNWSLRCRKYQVQIYTCRIIRLCLVNNGL